MGDDVTRGLTTSENVRHCFVMGIRNNVTLPKAVRLRKTRFYQALVPAGLSMSAWARSQKVTPGHLSQVLNGARDGFALDAKIDAFIAKHLKDLADVA